MFCKECGAQNPDNNKFCNSCGKPLGAQPQTAVAAPPAAGPSAPPGTPPAAEPAPAAPRKNRRNWPGFASLILGVLSWVILTGILALSAIVLGILSFVWFRRASGRIGISSVIGILLGIGAVAVTLALS